MPTSMRRERTVYKGTLSVTLVSGPQTVVFPNPMPGPYDLYFRTDTGVTVTAISSQTLSGFTLQLGVSLSGSMTWVAVEQLT